MVAWAPLIGAGISGVASLMGGAAGNDAAEMNNYISLMNYYAQQAAQQRARQEASRQQHEGKLGQTDAAGNRTYFVPGRGWVTDLSDDQQTIHDMSEQEQIRQLSQGARDEQVQERSVDRRNREDVSATDAERMFREARRDDPEGLRQLFLARGAEQRNRSADRAGNALARQNIRAGGRNAGELLQGARASADASNARQAGVEAQLMSGQVADQDFSAKRGEANQLYDYFRKMSTSGTGNAPVFQPNAPQRTSTALADQGAINAAGRHAEMDYQQPNLAWSNAISNVGSSFGAGFDRYQQSQYQQAMLDAFGRMGGGGHL